jgi:hypothetical protein
VSNGDKAKHQSREELGPGATVPGRRDFLKTCALAAAGLSLLPFSNAESASAQDAEPASNTPQLKDQAPMNKTVLSFFIDDTTQNRGADTFGKFLDYVKAEGIAGESTVLLGSGRLSEPTTEVQRAYIEQLHRAFECGIDSHMEVMTHGGKYDFQRHTVPEGAIYEGLWLHEPDVSVEEYESYFWNVIVEGEKIGVRFTGLTWPGGGGPETDRRYAQLRQQGVTNLNPHCWHALLNLAKAGKFRGRTVPCFVHSPREVQCMASDGKYGVYDMPTLGADWVGSWDNSREHVNPDFYITADGKSGKIAERVRDGAPYCFFYGHWQGMNPASGVGWEAFKTVVQRVKEFLPDRVVWMRPSQFTDWWHSRPAAG